MLCCVSKKKKNKKNLEQNGNNFYSNNSEKTHRNSNSFCFHFALLVIHDRSVQTTIIKPFHFHNVMWLYVLENKNKKLFSLERHWDCLSFSSGCEVILSLALLCRLAVSCLWNWHNVINLTCFAENYFCGG